MRLFPLTLTFGLIASQSAALSCLQPDVVRSFQWASDAEEAYVVLLGSFTFDAPPSSQTDDINAPRIVTYQSVFEGQFLGAQGFVPIAPIDVTITHDCAGPWCGSMVADQPVLAYVQMTDTAFELSVGPCGGEVFGRPSRQAIDQVEACIRGETCEPGGISR